MARTEIDGDQVQDETLTGDDVLDGSIQRRDLDITTVGQSVIRKLIAGQGVIIGANTGADQGTGDVTITSGSGDFGGNFASYFDPAVLSTTSNNWVEVFEQVIPAELAGRAIIFYTAELGQSLKSKSMGLLVEYRLNADAYQDIIDVRDGIVKNNQFQIRTGFFIVDNILATDTITVRLSFGQTDDGGAATIQNSGFVSWRV